jgi:hypothetical protein
MSTLRQSLKAPELKVGGQRVNAARIRIVESPLKPVSIAADLPAPRQKQPFNHGESVTCSVPELGAIAATIASQQLKRSTTRDLVTLLGTGPSTAWDPVSLSLEKTSRAAALNRLMCGMAIEELAKASGNDPRDRMTVLGQTSVHVAGRLALMGRQLLLQRAAGAVLVRPDEPGRPHRVARRALQRVRSRKAGAVRTIGPDPRQWAKAIFADRPSQGGCGKLIVPLCEAVSLAELRSGAEALQDIQSLSDFVVVGGPELLPVAPGQWIAIDGAPGHLLVTRRTLTWTRAHGWRIELRGGYPWRKLIDGNTPPEPCEVTGYDEATSKVLVRLHWHDGLVVPAFLGAPRVQPESHELFIPAVGDHGLVVFNRGADQGLYLSGALPAGVLSAADFNSLVRVGKTAGSRHHHGSDGKLQEHWKSVEASCQEVFQSKARTFHFDKV